MLLICYKCRAQKPTTEFSRERRTKRGYQGYCKACASRQVLEIYAKYPERYADRHKRYRARHPGAQEEADRRRFRNPEHRARRSARQHVNYRVSKGELPRASTLPCAKCGGQAQQYHHTHGYARENWLKIEPICRACHGLEHRKYPEKG